MEGATSLEEGANSVVVLWVLKRVAQAFGPCRRMFPCEGGLSLDPFLPCFTS